MKRKRTRLSVTILAACLAATSLAFGPAVLDGPAVYGYTAETAKSNPKGLILAPGVEHETKTMVFETKFRFREQNEKGQANGHIVHGGEVTNVVNRFKIDTANPGLRIELVSPGGKVAGKDTTTAMARENDREGHRVLGAFNADFFDVPTGVPIGLQVTDGEIYSSPAVPASTFFAVMPDGSPRMGGAVSIESIVQTEGGASLPLDGVNKIRTSSLTNAAILMTDRFGTSTQSAGTGGVEVVLSPAQPGAKLKAGETLSGVVEAIRTTNNGPIEPGKFVLAASGAKAKWLQANAAAGQTLSFRVDYGSELNQAMFLYGGADHPNAQVLLKDGEIPPAISDLMTLRHLDHHPRTVLATKGTEVYVFVFDGRQAGYSDGMSYLEGAAYMQSLGMENAINLDGGGSSTYAIRKPGESDFTVMNRPSDGAERPIGNALLLISTTP
ncbi:hypothetical protein J31TS4_12870 [Paenibacillus sp. J31TS4]|uniref:phosphodiester glycosidase family protein n=1 Tax=Paenibacillus sp. J31TS4 TaxID=2807195 RepID=UPI001AFCD88F|nr:phosphodiester glycosidase family protein [Paenibacillus sp. J31TS4]GIP38007.1 hypothetical protein J31TS4_12870 [Paenibacillus sp. J31TS4]